MRYNLKHLVMRFYVLLPFLIFSIFCHSQEQKYFTKFKPTEYVYGLPAYGCYYGKPTDSLKIGVNILKTKFVKGMECTMFQLEYKNEKITFWLGIKDSVLYAFDRNKLSKPLEMFDFRQKIKKLKDVPFLPFSKNCSVTEPFDDVVADDRYFSVFADDGLILGGLNFHNFYISLKRGFFFSVKSPDYELTYDSLEEI